MTTVKLTPTHSFSHSVSQSGQAAAPLCPPSPRQTPLLGSASTHTGRTTQPDPLASHLSDFLLWGDRHDLRLRPEGPSGQVSHHSGLSTGVLSSSNVTLAFWFKYDSHHHLQLLSLHFPDSLPHFTVAFYFRIVLNCIIHMFLINACPFFLFAWCFYMGNILTEHQRICINPKTCFCFIFTDRIVKVTSLKLKVNFANLPFYLQS